MGQNSDSETRQASSSLLTLDSLFDIKGPVRLVPQSASHKPHIVLRRERLSQNADERSRLAGTTRFSLVANKRFTISKGHTLSLGIADPTNEDELKLLNSEGAFLLEFDVINQLQMVDNLSSIPARMRKSMTGTKTYDAFAESHRPNSLGFPGYPLSIPETRVFASASVQTDPVESGEIAVSSSTRTPPSPKSHKQTSPLRLYPSPISADHSLEVLVDTPHSKAHDSDIDAPSERSFSSMDLSTPSQSRSNSPLIRSPSLPSNDSPLIPGPPDDDDFSMPLATSEPRTNALEDSGPCGVSFSTHAVKLEELKQPQTESTPCSIIAVHATPCQPRPKEKSQPTILDNPSTSPPQTDGALKLSRVATSSFTNTTNTTNPILDSSTNTSNTDAVPTMPRAMSAISQRAQSNLPTPTPQTTLSNPLGIRPSANLLSKLPPKGPRSLFGSIPATVQTRVVQPGEFATPALAPLAFRKPVVVGAKWTALRGSVSSSQANTNNGPTATTIGPSSVTISLATTPATKATVPALSQILRYSASPPNGEASSTTPSASKRQLVAGNVLNGQGSLKRARGGNQGEVKDKNQSHQHQPREVAEEHLRKKMKTENVEFGSLLPTPTSAVSLRQTNSLVSQSISPVDGTDSAADGIVRMSKSKRKRERQKLAKKRKANSERLAKRENPQEEDKKGLAAEERIKREEEEKLRKGEERAKEEKEKLETAAKLAQEKAVTAAAPALPAQQQEPVPALARVVHPLPPKPRTIPVTSSSYRPGRKRDRSGGSPSRSRSHSRGRETTQARRIRSKSRRRDSSVDRQQQDKRTNSSGEGVAQSAEGEHSSEAHLPRTTPTEAQAQPQPQVAKGNAKWPTTNPNRVFDIIGCEGGPAVVQHLAFSSDGKRLAVVCSDLVVGIWETIPQPREVSSWQANSSIVAITWLQYDIGVLVLFSDGSMDVWNPERGILTTWQRTTLFNVPLSGPTDKPVALAYGKDKIAISTTGSVKVWLFTSKGVWQPQREIKRSGVTALRFQTDGSALFGGCRDGTLWYCEVPNGTLKAYAFLQSNKCITSIHLHPSGTQLLISQKGGTAHLISHQASEKKGTVEKNYCAKSDDGTLYTAIFTTKGQAVVSGTANGCALVWDRKKGNAVYGLKHGIDDGILAIAAFDGRPGIEGMMVSGTRSGKLCWWPIPQAAIR